MTYTQFILDKKPRKLTRIICEWCGKEHMAERSDGKYCCDSHKTMACNKRTAEKREQEKRNEEFQRQWRIKQREKERSASTAQIITPKPPENNSSNQHFLDLQKSVEEMLEKTKRDQKLRDAKYDFEQQFKKLAEIGNQFLRFSSLGYIREFDIRLLWRKISNVLEDEKIRKNQSFQNHLIFIENELSEYLNQLEELERENDSRRLEFKLPVEVSSGLKMLTQYIPFPTEMVDQTK